MKLFLTKFAHQKLRYYVEQCEPEISGFGKVEKMVVNGTRCFVVTDLEIFNQTVSAAHSTMDDDALAKFLFEKTKAGEDLSLWKLWWHSHAKMNSFFSTTDTGTIDKSTEFPILISLVTNHKDEKVARMDIHDPFRAFINMEVVVLEEENEELKLQCAKEIKDKVKTFSYFDKKEFGFQHDSRSNLPRLPISIDLEEVEDEIESKYFDKTLLKEKNKLAKSALRDKGKYLTRKERRKLFRSQG